MQYQAVHYRTGTPITITTDQGRISGITETGAASGLPLAGPGLLDMQVNGYLGRDFNNPAAASPEDLAVITEAFLKLGIPFWVPTIITNTQAGILTLLQNIRRAVDIDPAVRKAVPGIHLEGPYITAEDGPRGAHDRRFVRPPSIDEYRAWQEACGGMIRIITFSPEHAEAAAFVRAITADGVIASIGHSNADRDQIKAAVDAGASLATHLGNGAHPLVPRHNCYIWELLAEDRVWAGLIGDGFHLPQAQFQNFIRAKRPEKVVLTSDTVYLGGMQPGDYKLGELAVRMRPDGKIVVADNEAIMAGASFHLLYSIANAVRLAHCSREDAWMMASENPAKMMKLDGHPLMQEGDPAVFTLFRWDSEDRPVIDRVVDERV